MRVPVPGLYETILLLDSPTPVGVCGLHTTARFTQCMRYLTDAVDVNVTFYNATAAGSGRIGVRYITA